MSPVRALALDGALAPERPPAQSVPKACQRGQWAQSLRELPPALDIPTWQISTSMAQKLLQDGAYTDFTFVDNGRGPVTEADLQLGRHVRVDCRQYCGLVVEGTIVNLAFDVHARKTLVRVRVRS